jgi:hypothetical protein
MIVAGACGVMALTSAVAAFLPAARADSRSSGVAAWSVNWRHRPPGVPTGRGV